MNRMSEIKLKAWTVIIFFGFLAGGCGKANKSAINGVRLGTNDVGLVSIGVLNTLDGERQRAIEHFFYSQGVLCVLDGTVMFDLLVQQSQVELAHDILKTNPPPEPAFQSAWGSR